MTPTATHTQTARALEFLHEASQIHTNVTPSAILINGKGDWKMGGVAYLTSLKSPLSSDGYWAFEDGEEDAPVASFARDLDYEDPAHTINRLVSPANDMYSLGAVCYAIFHKGSPPRHYYDQVRQMQLEAPRVLSEIQTAASWHELGHDLQGAY